MIAQLKCSGNSFNTSFHDTPLFSCLQENQSYECIRVLLHHLALFIPATLRMVTCNMPPRNAESTVFSLLHPATLDRKPGKEVRIRFDLPTMGEGGRGEEKNPSYESS